MSGIGKVLLKNVRRLVRDQRAVTAIEFGMLAFPFFAIVGAILQTSVVFLASQVLESAVHDAARTIWKNLHGNVRRGMDAGNMTLLSVPLCSLHA